MFQAFLRSVFKIVLGISQCIHGGSGQKSIHRAFQVFGDMSIYMIAIETAAGVLTGTGCAARTRAPACAPLVPRAQFYIPPRPVDPMERNRFRFFS